MPRIRTIKPEMPEDERLGACSRDARLMFVLLITQSDCHGNQRATLPLLRGKLFPYDDDIGSADLDRWLGELEAQGLVSRYQVDGQSYLSICRWDRHQKVHKPAPSTIPPPPVRGSDADEPERARDYAADTDPPEPAQRKETDGPRTVRGSSVVDLDLDRDQDRSTNVDVGVEGDPVDNFEWDPFAGIS